MSAVSNARDNLRKSLQRISPSALRHRARVVLTRVRRHRRLIVEISLLFTLAVTTAWAAKWFSIRDVELTAYDKALRLMTRENRYSQDVVVLAVDDKTLQGVSASQPLRDLLGPWPYSRVVWAEVVRYLKEDGARALVFDLVMDERGQDGPNMEFRNAILETGLPVYIGAGLRPTKDPVNLLPAVEAYNRLPGEKLLAQRPRLPDEPPDTADGEVDPAAFDIGGDSAEPEPPSPVLLSERRVWETQQIAFPAETELAHPLVRTVRNEDGTHDDLFDVPLPPTGLLLDALAGVGLVDPEQDEDGVLRRTRFVYTDERNTYVTLPVAVAADLLGARGVRLDPGKLRIGNRSWDVNRDGTALIDYGGSLYDRFDRVPLIDLLRNAEGQRAVDKGRFKDKVVVVGGLALATQDAHPTPFVSISPGVVKQATLIDTLLGGHFITEAPWWLAMLVTFLVALVSATLATTVNSSVVAVGWPIALYAGFFAVTGFILRVWHIHVPATMAVWAGIGASLTGTAITRLFADRNRERLKESFGRYLDKTLVEQMAESNELPRLEGENREITAFFSDIRAFSTFSEGMKSDPQKLVRILNEYLTRVSAALMKEGGCIDKYIGDAVVCLFGAPMRQEDHAVRACRGALAVQAEVSRLREEFRKQGLPDVYTRVGLNSGVMFVGNFGSEQLFDYTAMGDDMNLASRLEGANKAYDTNIMLGQKTYALAKDHIEVREVDRVRVAGKKDPVVVYELLALKGQLTPQKREQVTLYEEALALYRAAKFDEAVAALDRLDALTPDDGPSHTLRKRCQKYREHLPEGFDGVANLEK